MGGARALGPGVVEWAWYLYGLGTALDRPTWDPLMRALVIDHRRGHRRRGLGDGHPGPHVALGAGLPGGSGLGPGTGELVLPASLGQAVVGGSA